MEYIIEIWKDIKGFEGKYQVSNTGKVRSLNFGNKGVIKELTPHIKRGYWFIDLYLSKCNNKKKEKHFSVHRLVAEAFIDNLDNKPMVDHIDNNKLNNNVSNLRWVTARENGQNQRKKKEGAATSKYVGVYWNKVNLKFHASISLNGKLKYLGYFEDEVQAALAYDSALIQLGLPPVNFPFMEHQPVMKAA